MGLQPLNAAAPVEDVALGYLGIFPWKEAGDGAQQGRLAGTIHPYDADHCSLRNDHRYIPDSHQSAVVGHLEVVDPEQRFLPRHAISPSRQRT